MAELIAVPAVMARLGIGRTKLYELIDSGELRSVKIGSRRFVTDAAVDDFITRLDQRPSSPTG
ncbi:helix-turn-helix domain-containing protein [Mycobacterium haemophilum]